MSVPDWLSAARLILVGLLSPFALAGEERVVGMGLVAAGLTDALDGFVARRLGVASRRGAVLDAVADMVLMLSAAVWLGLMHPEIASQNGPLLAAAAFLYTASLAASLVAFGRLVDPKQLVGKVAGGLLYLFALFTLLTGTYEALLLDIALAALAVYSLQTILAATRTVHRRAMTRRTRSHAPQASNEVARSASPAITTATSAAPSTSDITP